MFFLEAQKIIIFKKNNFELLKNGCLRAAHFRNRFDDRFMSVQKTYKKFLENRKMCFMNPEDRIWAILQEVLK